MDRLAHLLRWIVLLRSQERKVVPARVLPESACEALLVQIELFLRWHRLCSTQRSICCAIETFGSCVKPMQVRKVGGVPRVPGSLGRSASPGKFSAL